MRIVVSTLASVCFTSVLGLAACSFGNGSSDPGDGPDDDPPDDRMDAPLPEDDDPDKDLVKTPVDNCPTAPNPLQANDDGDARGDACDTCPWKANESAEDLDGDKLTDDCDPDPRHADSLVYFEGFDKLASGENLPAGWSERITGGTWTVSTENGTLTGQHAASADAAMLIHDLGKDYPERLYVRAAGLFTGTGGKGQAGIAGDVDLTSAPVAGAFCDVTLDAGKSVAGYFRGVDSSEEGNTVGNLNNQIALRLTVGRAGTVRCDAKGQNVSSATHVDDTADRAGTAIALRVGSGTASYRFVAVIKLNPQSQPSAQ